MSWKSSIRKTKKGRKCTHVKIIQSATCPGINQLERTAQCRSFCNKTAVQKGKYNKMQQ